MSIENPLGIQKFIEQKKKIEQKRPLLFSDPRIITIDGVDGVGKSSISKKLYEKFRKVFGDENVIFVDITNLRGTPKQEKLNSIIQKTKISDKQIDRAYVAGVNRAYEELIVPALENGKFIIVDRSEVDLLRHTIEKEREYTTNERIKNIQNGTATHRLWAGNRIFLESSADDIWNNLLLRSKHSKHDPNSLEEVKIRLMAEKRAEDVVLSMSHSGDINVVRKQISRVQDQTKIEEYFDKIAEDIFEKLNISIPDEKNTKVAHV